MAHNGQVALLSREQGSQANGGRPRAATLASVAMATPEQVVRNDVIATAAGVTEQWIVHRTGVRERRHVREGERLRRPRADRGHRAARRRRRRSGDPRDARGRQDPHVDCIDRFGNTSAATLPIALADARDRGMLEPEMNVLLAAFGAGFTWGAGVIEWPA